MAEDRDGDAAETADALDRIIEGTNTRAMVAKMRSDQRGLTRQKEFGRMERDARRDLRPLGR